MATTVYPLNLDRDYPMQKENIIDFNVYVMRFIKQILHGEKLRLPQNDVPYLRLKYIAHILTDSIAHSGDKPETSMKDELIGDP